MQQQTSQPMNTAPSTPLHLVTTEQIQKCLDENKNLIMAIMENQNMGKVAECAQFQAVLQKNLMYLAAVADAQAPTSSLSSQGVSPMMMQAQSPMGHQQTAAKLNSSALIRPQDHQNQIQLQQQHLHSQFGNPNNFLMQPGLGGGPRGA